MYALETIFRRKYFRDYISFPHSFPISPQIDLIKILFILKWSSFILNLSIKHWFIWTTNKKMYCRTCANEYLIKFWINWPQRNCLNSFATKLLKNSSSFKKKPKRKTRSVYLDSLFSLHRIQSSSLFCPFRSRQLMLFAYWLNRYETLKIHKQEFCLKQAQLTNSTY